MNKPVTWRQLRDLVVLATLLTACAAYMWEPMVHPPRSSLEPVEGTVTAKKTRRPWRTTSTCLFVATPEGERSVMMNGRYRSTLKQIGIGDRLDCLLSENCILALDVNGRQVFTYEDYCRSRDNEAWYGARALGAIAAIIWVVILANVPITYFRSRGEHER